MFSEEQTAQAIDAVDCLQQGVRKIDTEHANEFTSIFGYRPDLHFPWHANRYRNKSQNVNIRLGRMQQQMVFCLIFHRVMLHDLIGPDVFYIGRKKNVVFHITVHRDVRR